MKRILDQGSSMPVARYAGCCVEWRMGEDDSDDHSEAKMGGEPGPTGRANLFDTRKTYGHFRE
jgi:hypothetical protein